MMNRRQLMGTFGAASLASMAPQGWAQQTGKGKLLKPLVLIELKGGNDGLNAWVPYADPQYYAMRPNIAIAADSVLKITANHGLHPGLSTFKSLWDDRALAVIQGVGYAAPNQSHFRSIDIWDTASNSQDTLLTGWLTRAFASIGSQAFSADAVMVGSSDSGPARGGARAITITNPQGFAAQAKLVNQTQRVLPGALAHVAKVENDIVGASVDIKPVEFKTEFNGNWSQVVRAASTVLASKAAPVVRLTLGGFDTHRDQLGPHARLMETLSSGIGLLKSALTEYGVWQDTVVLTYSEFGRRPAENGSKGTDHGTANVMFATGGRVKAGVFGNPIQLNTLDGVNAAHTTEFRRVYATVLAQHWGMNAVQIKQVLGGDFAPLGFIA